MSDLSEVKQMLDETADLFTAFRQRNDSRLDGLEGVVASMQATAQRSGLPSGRFPADGENKTLREALRSFLKGDETQMKAMAVGNDPSGGFAVYPQLSDQINKVEIDFSPVRQVARIVTIQNADAFEELIDKESAGATWVSEQQARPATSTPQLFKQRIPVNEIYAMPETTQQLIDDGNFDVVEWAVSKVGQQFGAAEGAAFITGDGLGKPRGFLAYPTAATADGARAWGTFEHVATGTSGGFGTDPNGANKLIELVHKLKAGYRSGAVWLMNKKTAGEVRKLKDTAGRFVWVDSLLAGVPPSLLGYPVVEAEDMPDVAANSLSIAFGNFRRGYIVVDRTGVRLLLDPFTNKPYVRLYMHKRVGGDASDFNAIKMLKFA